VTAREKEPTLVPGGVGDRRHRGSRIVLALDGGQELPCPALAGGVRKEVPAGLEIEGNGCGRWLVTAGAKHEDGHYNGACAPEQDDEDEPLHERNPTTVL
jgi:hypothetical protein